MGRTGLQGEGRSGRCPAVCQEGLRDAVGGSQGGQAGRHTRDLWHKRGWAYVTDGEAKLRSRAGSGECRAKGRFIYAAVFRCVESGAGRDNCRDATGSLSKAWPLDQQVAGKVTHHQPGCGECRLSPPPPSGPEWGLPPTQLCRDFVALLW